MTTPKLLNKNERTMPKWVHEANDRIGPKPPTPPMNGNSSNGTALHKAPTLPPKVKNQPEPDYEVIEFSGQQYSNEPLKTNVVRNKTPDNKLKCTLCGSTNPWVTCAECAGQIFCASCDDMFHKHPKRKNHMRKAVELGTPPIPPKIAPGQAGPTPPVAPPRRGKRGLLTPFLQRKEQINPALIPPPSPTPSQKFGGWQDRVGSLKRSMSISMNNRPLPETPKTSQTPSEAGASSRSTTPKSVFDNIQRPPSVQLEKIKNKASATLDRMAILQQRYRQQKENQERERNGSITDQQFQSTFDHWSNISPSPSHFRSGSMSSGLNSSHFDLSDDTTHHFNSMLFQRQQAQKQALGGNRSTSVFNLNAPASRRPIGSDLSNGWMQSQRMQQAQSMAQLNSCASCNNHQSPAWSQQHQQHHHHAQNQHHMHPDEWAQQFGSQQQFNHSNLSLNMGPGYMPQQQMMGQYPPPVFMTQRGMMPNMYPYNYGGGMPVMQPGIMGMPPSASRAASRAGSRFGSPTPSRKSLSTRRSKRNSYVDDELTDDEDSDQDDRRSIISNRSGMTSASRSHHHHHHQQQQHHQQQIPRQRRLSSASQLHNDEDNELNHHTRRHRIRDRRGSVAKSVQSEWLPERRDSNTLRRNDSGMSTPAKQNSRIYSDLESEGSGTRALVQAKIQQKLEEERAKQKEYAQKASKKKTQVEKKSTEVQAGHVVKTVDKPERVEPRKEATKENIASEQEEYESEAAESEAEEEAEEQEEEKQEQEQSTTIQPTVSEVTKNGIEPEADADSLGPPPSTPDYEWECEFCTFVNEPNIKICSICCKTPSKPPTSPKGKTAAQDTKPKPAKETTKAVEEVKIPQQQKPIKPKSSTTTTKSAASTSTTNATTVQTSTTKSKSTTSSSSTSTAINGTVSIPNNTKTLETSTALPSKLKHPNSENESDNSIAKGFLNKESVDNIWTTLDESIQAQADKVLKKSQKVSTACGSSPVREVTANCNAEEKRDAREMATSPPPQSISTQTYDTLPFGREDTFEQTSNALLEHERYKTPEPTKLERRSPYYRSYTQLPLENERYRSASDLRYHDGYSGDYNHSNTVTRRPSFINDLKSLQHLQQSSPFGLPSDVLSYEPRPARDPETELHIILKELDLYKFTVEELQAALKYCGTDVHPIQWLRENWHKLIQTVQSLATKYGQERAENTIGSISQTEAREALRLSSGNVWQAISECIEQRQRKFRELHAKGNFLREDIVNALTAHQGNVEQALLELNRTQLKPFLMRIWGSPGGVENESGPGGAAAVADPSPTQMKSDIHEFLNTHALDCLQTPNTIGSIESNDAANLTTPFDSFSDSRSNLMSMHLDNSSVKSTYNTPSPYQLEDGTLKNLEILIGNMEQIQAKQNQEVLRSIESMLENFKGRNDTDFETDPEVMRIMTKSPIVALKSQQIKTNEESAKSAADVKNFVWQHIQDIVPNLVQQVEQELMERPEEETVKSNTERQEQIVERVENIPREPTPIDIMEEVIKPNLREASIKEELPPNFIYATEIANFRLEFDRGASAEHESDWEPDSLENANLTSYKMYIAPNLAESIANAKTPEISEISEETYKSAEETKDNTTKIVEKLQQVEAKIEKNIEEIHLSEAVVTGDEKTIVHDSANIIKKSTVTNVPSLSLKNESLDDQPSSSKGAIRKNKRSQLPRNSQKQDKKYRRNTDSNESVEYSSEIKQTNQNEIEQVAPLLPETENISTVSIHNEINESQVTEKNSSQSETKFTSSKVSTLETEIDTTSIDVPQNGTQDYREEQKTDTIQLEATTPDSIESSPRLARVSRIPVRHTLSTNSLRSESISSVNTPTLVIEETNVENSVLDKVENRPTTEESNRDEPNVTAIEESTVAEIQNITAAADALAEYIQARQLEDFSENRNDETIAALEENNVLTKEDGFNEQINYENMENVSSLVEANTQEEVKLTSSVQDNDNEEINNEIKSNVERANTSTEINQIAEAIFAEVNSEMQLVETTVEALEDAIKTPTIEETISSENTESVTDLNVSMQSSETSNEEPLTPDEVFQDADEYSDKEETVANEETVSLSAHDDVASEAELYSIASDGVSSVGDDGEHIVKLRDDTLSPQSTSEVLLLLNNEQDSQTNEISVSASNTTISSHSSQETNNNNKLVLKEFIPSGDPTKQNLSELVEDTQRLIKQMREEISMDEFESTDEDDYTDEEEGYSDEYGSEEWYEEDEEEYDEEEGYEYENQTPVIEEASSGAEQDEEDDYAHRSQAAKTAKENKPTNNDTETSALTKHEAEINNHMPHSTNEQSLNTQLQNKTESLSSTETTTTTKEKLVITETKSMTANNTEILTNETNTVPMSNENLDQVTISTEQKIPQTENVEPHTETILNLEPSTSATQEIDQGMVTGIPITPQPIIEDSESRPPEPATETVLQKPKNIKSKETKKVSSNTKSKTTSDNANTTSSQDNESSTTSMSILQTSESKQTAEVQSVTTATTANKPKSNISKIPKPTDMAKTTITKKLTTRSKSFSGPAAPIGISSVKTIQQEFLQKQNQLSSQSKVPTKKQAPIVRKKSITDAINKFTKTATTTTSTIHDGPSTSSGAATAASSSNGNGTLLRSKTQPRLPKKKYHETCFSDDYQSTTEEEPEPEPLELRTRKLSMPVFRAYPSVQEVVIEEPEVLARKYVEQDLVTNIAEAHIAAALVNMKFQEDVALWAAKECSDLDQAISMLQQECELCMNNYPMNQIVSMLKCTHKCCKQCAKSYFTVQITDRSINDCNCPYCKLPELSNVHEHEDEHLEYFSNLDIFLKSILDTDVHELFQRKLRDRTLLQDPNFKWCIQCSSGFFARPKQKRLICPDCGSVTCAHCRKPWERQHEGTSCEAYLEWKQENDPELQAQGVQEHLAQNGIDCPKCKFRYSLARGGCMHFTCTQCKFEFCYGCARPFMMGAKCNISTYCAKLGLHAHHPRNCLFYLRDKIPLQLQFLLKENKVSFDIDPITPDDESSSSSKARASARCPIPLQKETPQGLVDTVCNQDVPEKHAGMCRTHYVEYLSAKVAKAKIDPLPIFDLTDCVQELRRRGIALPERGPWDTDEIYKNMCTEVIKKNIPLNSA